MAPIITHVLMLGGLPYVSIHSLTKGLIFANVFLHLEQWGQKDLEYINNTTNNKTLSVNGNSGVLHPDIFWFLRLCPQLLGDM